MIDYTLRYANLSPDKKALLTLRTDKLVPRQTPPADDAAGKRLVAYVVWKQEQPAQTADLRSYLKDRLPEYMIPSAYVVMETLPLTPNGKVDRRALPAPDGARPELAEAFVAPRNAVEETLANIWAEVLGIEQIGIHDNFFDLGGHSLLATQVMARIQTAFSVELPLRAIFETPTIAALGLTLVQKQATGTDDAELLQMLEEVELEADDDIAAES
jgi:acyl carrier protein